MMRRLRTYKRYTTVRAVGLIGRAAANRTSVCSVCMYQASLLPGLLGTTAAYSYHTARRAVGYDSDDDRRLVSPARQR